MPVFSLGARLDGAGKATKSPGPANYPPHLYNVKKVPIYPFYYFHVLYKYLIIGCKEKYH